LARQLQIQGYAVTIYNFTLQYPSFLFPGKTQFAEDNTAPKDLNIKRRLNSVNPLNWISVGNELKNLKPDLLIVRYWIPLMGPAFGTVLRKVKKNHHTKIIAIADNIIPHEKRPGDSIFTRYFLKPCDAVITMSEKVLTDLRSFDTNKPAVQLNHPLYDNFGEMVDKEAARKLLGINQSDQVLLFFGFIRKYKGLDLLMDAIGILKKKGSQIDMGRPRSELKLLIAGEFYEDEKIYQQKIEELGIADSVILHTGFISDERVKYFFSAADVVVQPYRNATQSGVTPLAYHFEKPMIVTNVGALPDYVPHEKAGLVAEANAASIAESIQRYFELGETYFIPHLREEKKKYSWKILVDEIVKLAETAST
jgi:glycosyltransferase involved in cell wall biosynthesis